jgi:competence protein ComFC
MKAASICVDCYQREDTYFLANRSAVHYNGKMKAIISQYKFRGHETLSSALANFLEEAFHKYYILIPFDCITFVPLHESRLRERGFNQAQLLANQLGLRLKLPVKPLLTRIRPTDKQSQKDRRGRLQFLEGALQMLPLQAQIPSRVLIVDDIYTTGTTMNACAKALAKEGIVVYSLTVAR